MALCGIRCLIVVNLNGNGLSETWRKRWTSPIMMLLKNLVQFGVSNVLLSFVAI